MTLYSLDGISPEIGAGAWVAPTAQLMGKVRLGARASVWFGAVLRGDNEWIDVGEGANVQENAVCHTDPGMALRIGRDCTIGHRAMLHGCTIGVESLIGMGATVLNGAVIGRNCLVGACALVTEGKEIPDGSLVLGAPGKVVRALAKEEIEGLRTSALGYQRNAARFRDGLSAL